MMRYDLLGRFIRELIVISILLLPMINMLEIGKYTNLPLPNINIRIFKEIVLILIVVLSLIRSIVTHHFNKTYRIFVFFMILLLVVLLNSINCPNLVIICGLRWYIPFFLFVFMYDIVDFELMTKIYRVMRIVFIIHVSLQIYELFYMPHIFGDSIVGGLAGRVPGIMSLSHASALFACIFYMLLPKFEKNEKTIKIFTLLVVVSLALVMSTTGVIVFGTLYFVNRYNKLLNSNKILYMLVPLLAVLLYGSADTITGRIEGSSESSFGTRLDQFVNLFANSEWVSSKFGMVTNGLIIMNQQGNTNVNAIFGDSFYNSIIVNLGLIAFFLFVGFVLCVIRYSISHNFGYLLCFMMLFSLCSVSTIVVEIFPANIILSAFIAFFIKSYDTKSFDCLELS